MSDSDVLAGRYELGAVVGRGGMADVYQATDLLLHRTVAVKVLRDPAGDAAEGARFAVEARTLAGLNHLGLVTLLDAGLTEGRPFLVMELVDGPTLHSLIARRELSASRLAHVGAQVADALAYVHSRSVLHRDVKPGNVLVGAGDRVKLADFGIARLIGDTVRHTRTGQTIGTAAYLAPEQVMGEDLSPAVDVYALGLVLLEATTGERAYPGTPTEAAFARISRSPVVPGSLPAPWPDLLEAMTTREPSHRPTAAEVAATLHDVRRSTSLATTVPADAVDRADTAERTVAMAPPTRWAAPRAVRRTVTEIVLRPPSTRPVWVRPSVTMLTAAALLILAVVLTATTGAGSPPAESATSVASPPASTVPSAAPLDPVAAVPVDQPVSTSSAASPVPTRSAPATKVVKPRKATKGKGKGKHGKGKGKKAKKGKH